MADIYDEINDLEFEVVTMTDENGDAVEFSIIDNVACGGERYLLVVETELMDDDETDPLLNEAIQTVIETGQASTSFIQRRFKVGYARAGRIIDQMEERGIISGYQGSKPREVLMSKERWEELNTQEQA